MRMKAVEERENVESAWDGKSVKNEKKKESQYDDVAYLCI
jgi:hypothetical protein